MHNTPLLCLNYIFKNSTQFDFKYFLQLQRFRKASKEKRAYNLREFWGFGQMFGNVLNTPS